MGAMARAAAAGNLESRFAADDDDSGDPFMGAMARAAVAGRLPVRVAADDDDDSGEDRFMGAMARAAAAGGHAMRAVEGRQYIYQSYFYFLPLLV